MIEPVTAMAGIVSELSSLATAATSANLRIPQAPVAASGGASFADFFNAAVNQLDASVAAANGKVKSFASGDQDIPLSDVMISLEQANLALQLASNVRDKVAAAYTNIMNMPV